jgi:LmbE family N-acetylglucosaminyl deacetylase
MATIVSLHAHPDDETIVTGGAIARYAALGHRVVLVFATKGEHGEVPDGFLDDGETLAQRREDEVQASAEILGAARVAYLGYVDSGMMGTPENDAEGSFWRADLEDAAGRFAELLRDERADVAIIYDENGNYGHPDHIQVHRVGVRACELAGIRAVYEATTNRDHFKRGFAAAREAGVIPPDLEDAPDEPFLDSLGVTEDRITHALDVRDLVDVKRAAMRAHASQIAEASFFLQMPDDTFRDSFGWEWFIRHGIEPPPVGDWYDDLLRP